MLSLICYILVYSFISYTHTLYTCALFSFILHTHWSLSVDPEFARSDIGCFMLLIRCSLRSYMFQRAGVSTYSGIIAFFYSCYYSLIPVYQTSLLFHFLFHLRSCVDIICIITMMLILHNDYIACSSYFRLSVYTWGILLAYIRRRLSSRLRFHVL